MGRGQDNILKACMIAWRPSTSARIAWTTNRFNLSVRDDDAQRHGDEEAGVVLGQDLGQYLRDVGDLRLELSADGQPGLGRFPAHHLRQRRLAVARRHLYSTNKAHTINT